MAGRELYDVVAQAESRQGRTIDGAMTLSLTNKVNRCIHILRGWEGEAMCSVEVGPSRPDIMKSHVKTPPTPSLNIGDVPLEPMSNAHIMPETAQRGILFVQSLP